MKYSDKKVYSPVINEGEADMIISFELLEAARWLPYLKKGGTIIVNNQQISPMPVITGAASYPENILSLIHIWQGKLRFDYPPNFGQAPRYFAGGDFSAGAGGFGIYPERHYADFLFSLSLIHI